MKTTYKVSCPFCAVGCRFKILKGVNDVLFSDKVLDNIDFDYDNPVNTGSLCPRGHFSYELLNIPNRLNQAYFKNNGRLKPEVPEVIFNKLGRQLSKNKDNFPLAIIFSPLLSVHDIKSLLEFAINNKCSAVDFLSLTDRHMFRALADLPFYYNKIEDIRKLNNLNAALCIGDIFTNQPVLSKHLLKAKYTFRDNVFISMNPLPSRTGWFADLELKNPPHFEPLYLFYILHELLEQKNNKNDVWPELEPIRDLLEKQYKSLFSTHISNEEKKKLSQASQYLKAAKHSGIFLSAQLNNSSGNYLNATLCAAISKWTNSDFIPLYETANLSYLEELTHSTFKRLRLGRRPILAGIMEDQYKFAVAAGWNPKTEIPGTIPWGRNFEWIITALAQDDFPENSKSILPQTHFFEQLDLRYNFIPLQSSGSEPVKSAIGSSQSLANYAYLMHNALTENKVNLDYNPLPALPDEWDKCIELESEYYLSKILQPEIPDKKWLIPLNHITQYGDGSITKLSSWAKKDYTAEELIIAEYLARAEGIENKKYFTFRHQKQKILFKAVTSKVQPGNVLTFSAHYQPARQLMEFEIAPHNKDAYCWCPRVTFNHS